MFRHRECRPAVALIVVPSSDPDLFQPHEALAALVGRGLVNRPEASTLIAMRIMRSRPPRR
jgi:hypothetical protein